VKELIGHSSLAVHEGYISCGEEALRKAASAQLHLNATDPLTDTPARPWSQQRDSTMRICCQEAKRLIELLPKAAGERRSSFASPGRGPTR